MFNYLTQKIKDNLFLTFGLLLIFHMFLSVFLFLIANSDYLISHHNGAGIWLFSADSMLYHNQSLQLLEFLNDSNWANWWDGSGHFHVRVASIIYWLSGFPSPISFEIINGPLWALSILLMFQTSRLIFKDNSVAVILTVLFFLLPSVLIHSTQLLRDPFVIFSMCLLTYGWALLDKSKINLKAIFYILIGVIVLIEMKYYLNQIILLVFISYLIYIFFSKDASKTNILIIAVSLFLLINGSLNNASIKRNPMKISNPEVDFGDKSSIQDAINSPYSNTLSNIEALDNDFNMLIIDPLMMAPITNKESSINTEQQRLPEMAPITNKESSINTEQQRLPKMAPITNKESSINTEQQRLPEMAPITNKVSSINIEQQRLPDKQSLSILQKEERVQDFSLLKDFILLHEKIDQFYGSKKYDKKQRSEELREASVIRVYLEEFKNIPIIFESFNQENVDLSYLKLLVAKNTKNLNSRMETLIQHEEDWQRKNKITKFFDINVWKIVELRNSFSSRYNGTNPNQELGSAIDPFIGFIGFSDGLMYLPRALQIAFLSPFPTHWLEVGATTGRIGRIISGFEMIILYLIYIGFLYAVLFKFAAIKRLIPVIILSGVVLILASYTIPNMGTLFRFRIDFIIPFYLVGAFGISLIIDKLNEKKKKI